MTIKELNEIIERNNIPENAKLWSDSGWEVDKTEIEGVYYDPKNNNIIFTQELDNYVNDKKYKKLK